MKDNRKNITWIKAFDCFFEFAVIMRVKEGFHETNVKYLTDQLGTLSGTVLVYT